MQEFTGKAYVKIALANAYGLDKMEWAARINWVDNQETPELIKRMETASDPFMYTKCLHAKVDMDREEPTGFIMGLDATASGLQLMACLTGCEDTARNTNLINTGTREDIYTKVAHEMSAILGRPVSRSAIKHPVMTTFYGSKAQPKALFGEGTPELKAFYQVLNKELSGAMSLMRILQSHWNPLATKHEWTLPDKWKESPLKPCYNVKVQKLKKELACLKKLVNGNTEEV